MIKVFQQEITRPTTDNDKTRFMTILTMNPSVQIPNLYGNATDSYAGEVAKVQILVRLA